MSLDPVFKDSVNTTLMDSIFNLADEPMRWRLWLNATSVGGGNDFNRIVDNMMYDGYDMETWIAAAVSQRQALMGELEWVSGI